MKDTVLQKHLESLGACLAARKWASDKSPQQCWDECERADWLLWWAAVTTINSKMSIVKAAAACARHVLAFVPSGELRPLQAIEAAESWASNPNAADAAAAAASAAAAYAADAAAAYDAYADAAYAAAAYDAYAAAAYDAYAAAAYAAAADAEYDVNLKMCEIIRSILVCPI
jgi:hypothetical protein